MTAILLAAGYGTRVRALFPDTPKALIPVGGRALLDHLLANIARSGAIETTTLVTNDRFLPAFERHLAAHAAPLPVRLLSDGTAHERQRLGSLGDLALALDRLECTDTVLVAATDKLLAFELAKPLAFARRRAAAVNVCVQMPDRTHIAGKHGCVLLDGKGRIVDFEEKPAQPKSSLASLAIYVLPPAAHSRCCATTWPAAAPPTPPATSWPGWRSAPRSTATVAPGPSYDVGTPATYAAAQRAYTATSAPHVQ